MTEADRKLEILTPPESQGSASKQSNRYLLFNQIGSGGMASVFVGCLAGAEGFERLVAIKRIHEHLAKEAVFRDMFLDEARVAATLQHPNLVQVTDFGLEGDRPYLVMEYVNGEPLSAVLQHCQELTRAIPIVLGARIVAWAAEGLHAAHETRDLDGRPQKLVHRDISPHNILVSYEGVVKVTDFGIAKAARRITSTDTGQIKGKLAYMSPEQAQARALDCRSDIFSLGIVLYETTVNRRCFKQSNKFETLRSIISGTYPRPRTIDSSYPEELEDIVIRALEPRLTDRYQTAREMQRDLERFLMQGSAPVGTAEVSEFMHALFEQRITSRAEMVASAARGKATEAQAEVDLTGSTTMIRTTLKRVEPKGSTTRRVEPILMGMLFGIAAMVVVLIAASWWMNNTEFGETTTLPIARRAITLPGPVGDDEISTFQPVVQESNADADTARPLERLAANDAGGTSEHENTRDAAEASSSVFAPTDEPEAPVKISTPERLEARTEVRRPRPDKRPTPAKASEPGWLSIMAHPWCEVYLGRRRLGRTPLVRVQVPSGRQVLRFLPEGKRPGHRLSVNVKAGRETPVSFRAP